MFVILSSHIYSVWTKCEQKITNKAHDLLFWFKFQNNKKKIHIFNAVRGDRIDASPYHGFCSNCMELHICFVRFSFPHPRNLTTDPALVSFLVFFSLFWLYFLISLFITTHNHFLAILCYFATKEEKKGCKLHHRSFP